MRRAGPESILPGADFVLAEFLRWLPAISMRRGRFPRHSFNHRHRPRASPGLALASLSFTGNGRSRFSGLSMGQFAPGSGLPFDFFRPLAAIAQSFTRSATVTDHY